MKLSSTPRRQEPVDLKDLYTKYVEQYDHVFIEDFGESGTFIFKTMGRKDFRELMESEAINNYLKEEVVCETCVLYPENYDFGNCEEAGLPTQLCKKIIERSMLKDSSQLEKAIHYCRDQLAKNLEDQITCVIHEAFPEYSIEEISNWDVIKTAEYMTKSEYILNNLRGVPLVPVQQVPETEVQQTSTYQERKPRQSMEDRFKKIDSNRPITNNDKHRLTPEKLVELERKFPEIDWRNDNVSKEGVSALQGQYFDSKSFAERSNDDYVAHQEDIPEALRHKFKVIKESHEPHA